MIVINTTIPIMPIDNGQFTIGLCHSNPLKLSWWSLSFLHPRLFDLIRDANLHRAFGVGHGFFAAAFPGI
jgi:hypothetical protein